MKLAKRSDRKRKCANCGGKFYTRSVRLYHELLYCATCRKPLKTLVRE